MVTPWTCHVSPEVLRTEAILRLGDMHPREALIQCERFLSMVGGQIEMHEALSIKALLLHPDRVQVAIEVYHCRLDDQTNALTWRRVAGDGMFFSFTWKLFSAFLIDGTEPVFLPGDVTPLLPRCGPHANP